MNIQRATPVNETLAKLIFLLLPTAAVGYFLLLNVNQYYSILQNQALQQAIYFAQEWVSLRSSTRSGSGFCPLLFY